jgi:hypothetical protein
MRSAQVGREHRAILRCLSDITAACMVAPVAGPSSVRMTIFFAPNPGGYGCLDIVARVAPFRRSSWAVTGHPGSTRAPYRKQWLPWPVPRIQAFLACARRERPATRSKPPRLHFRSALRPEQVPEQSHLRLFDRHKRQGEGQEIDPLPIDFEMIKKYGGTGTYVQILIRKLKRFLRAPQGQRA